MISQEDPDPIPGSRAGQTARALVSLGVACCLTPLACLTAVMFAGGGHGSYLPAKVLFPYTMLSTLAFGSITKLFMVVALMQFPLYGFILAMAALKNWCMATAVSLSLLHAFVAVVCFVLPMLGWS